MSISSASMYVYLGMLLGMVGGISYNIFNQQDKISDIISIISSCVIGVLVSIVMLGMQIDRFVLISIIAFGYVGASIIKNLTNKGGDVR